MSMIRPTFGRAHPVIACTGEELARLRQAYRNGGPDRLPVASMVDRAEEGLRRPVEFPPRGGQHNQWYQCEACQIALKTVDATHHECPRCGNVYTGEPYDDVVFSRVHGDNLRRMVCAAWAYAVTGESEFASFARDVLIGYAERYEAYPYHSASRREDEWTVKSGGYLYEQTLNESACMTSQIAPAYDLIHDAPILTDTDHERIRDGLLLPMLENIDQNKAGKSNWQTWHNAGILWGGAVLRDETWIEKAISDPENGFFHQMDISVTGEGMWYENSWGYHFYTLSAMVEITEGARRLGIDLWSHPVLKKMFTVPLRYAMPDGSLPRFGDDVRSSVASGRRHLELAYHAYGDDSMLPYLSPEPTWDTVMLGRSAASTGSPSSMGSEVLDGAGHAILRTNGEAGLASVMTFGPYGGFHGHFDKLSFVLFGLGEELGVDPGRAASQAYRLPIHRDWYKATFSHNTVLVDRKSQEPAQGYLELFATSERYAAAQAGCDEAYPGVKQRRLLLLTPTYLLAVDTLDADEARRFDWVYHSRGMDAVCDQVQDNVQSDDAFPGFEYLQNVRSGVTGDTVRVRFRGDPVSTCLTIVGEPGTTVLVGDGPGASVEERVPLTMVSRCGTQGRFVSVLEPVRDGRPQVSDLRVDDPDGGVRIQVTRGDAEDVVCLGDGSLEVTSDGVVVLKTS